jgi:hypothetical protein
MEPPSVCLLVDRGEAHVSAGDAPASSAFADEVAGRSGVHVQVWRVFFRARVER